MITIGDIALAAGVSKSTVSRVLNKRESLVPISAKTRQRVQTVARELGYRPNLLARGLKTKRSHILGIAIRDLTNPFWGGLIKGIVEGTAARGYHVILSDVVSQIQQEETAAMLLEQIGVEGLFMVGDFPGDDTAVRQVFSCCPFSVALCRELEPEIAPVIRVDDRRGIELIMEHLYSTGHRRFAFAGLVRPQGFADRYSAFRAFLESRGLVEAVEKVNLVDVATQPDVASFPSEDQLVELGASAARQILAQPGTPDALVCACDPMALGAIRVARELGLSVPGDLSIAGFDDTPLARYARPSLTTVRQPVQEMGVAAANLLIDLIRGRASRPLAPMLFTPELVVRESTSIRG